MFRDCDLRNSRFPGASLDEADLHGSQIAGMHVDANELRGTIIDPSQAADLVSLFGLDAQLLARENKTEYNANVQLP